MFFFLGSAFGLVSLHKQSLAFEMKCNGDETAVFDCSLKPSPKNCREKNGAGVICF